MWFPKRFSFPLTFSLFSARPLRSIRVTGLPRYYGPLRLPARAARGYLCPLAVALCRHAAPLPGLPGSSADLSLRAAPTHPGSPTTAFTHCFIAGFRLHPIRQAGHFLCVTRPKRFYLHCGSQVRLSGLRLNGLPRSTPDWLHVEWVIHKVSSFHLTRSARLALAHLMCTAPVEVRV